LIKKSKYNYFPNKCPICESKFISQYLISFKEYTFFNCINCDVDFCYPFKNPGSKWYEKFQVCYRLGYKESITWDHRQFFKTSDLQYRTLLDVGCGSGYFLSEARRRGFKVTGIDFDFNAISFGKYKFDLNDMYCGSLKSFKDKYPEKRYDIVTFFGVFEHLDNPTEFLDDVSSVLNPGGHISFTVPYRDRKPNFGLKEWWDQPPFHLTRWNKTAIRNILYKKSFLTKNIIVGRSQSDDVINWVRKKTFNKGIVSEIIHNADAEIDKKKKFYLIKKANFLRKLSHIIYYLLSIPINLGLLIFQATGKSMYVYAKKEK
jgi:SAM-dependent methyltransferase